MSFYAYSTLDFPMLYPPGDINDLGRSLGKSGTFAMNQKAKELGEKVISLSLGEPDLPPPQWVFQGVQEALNRQEYRYTQTAGLISLRQAIIKNFQEDTKQKPLSSCGLDVYSPGDVLVTTGAKQALFNALAVTLKPKKKILLPAPYWVSYGPMAHMVGGDVVVLDTGENHKICPQSLDHVLSQDRDIECLVFSSPSNPSGAVYTYEELKDILCVLQKYPHVLILWDAIYQHLVFDNKKVYHPLDINPSLHERFIFIDGPSKSFSLTGWRLGWAMGPRTIIDAMERYQSHSTTHSCSLAQYGCLGALEHEERFSFLEERRHIFQKRRDCFCQILKDVFGPSVSFMIPEGAFYVFADVSQLMKEKGFSTTMDLAMTWLQELYISCVPGDEFGKKNYLRFSFSLNEDKMQIAGERWAQWLKNTK